MAGAACERASWDRCFVRFLTPVKGCRIFFFFQAEDGIRDSSVTGVQTCALPICLVVRELRGPGGVTPGLEAPERPSISSASFRIATLPVWASGLDARSDRLVPARRDRKSVV